MKKRLLLTLMALMLTTATMLAVPAKPGLKKKVKQVDGSVIELTMHGDEHYSFYKDATGAPFQIVNGLAKKITPEEVTTKWTERKKANLNRGTVNSRRTNRIGEPSKSTTGKHKGLVILLEFKDVKFSVPDVKETYQRVFNESGYNEGGMAGSVRDYFLKQSYNQLTIDFDVVGPYSTESNLEKYGAPVIKDGEEIEHDKDAPRAMSEAVQHAISETSLNFADYDWDGDGVVDQVFIIFAGYSQAQDYSKDEVNKNSIWPHESHLMGWGYNLAGKDKDGNEVAINTYGCASELMDYEGTEMDGIGTACHEFSHCLGLPDMYDTDYSGGYGMATWDVMDSGSYLDDSRTPAGYTSYERWFSGWMEPKEIKEMTRIEGMKPLATDPVAYILYNEKNKNEYYLLENRQPVDFDGKLFGHGMLILHVDYNESAWTSNTVNTVADHQRVTIIPADNNFDFTEKGFKGDPWPGTAGNTQLTNYSTPAATLYNKNKDGQYLMSKSIDNITEDTDNNTISFVACRPELEIPVPSDEVEQEGSNSFSVKWQKVTGATGYEIELTTLNRASSDPAKALQNEFDFKDCYSEKAGYTDISTKLGSYGLPGWSGAILFTSPNLLKMGTSTKTGWVKTDTWKVPQSTDMTVVMGANVVKDPVDGKISITYGNEGESAGKQEASFTVTADGKQVFTFKDIRKDPYYLEINPTKQMYLNYLAIYDGIWTAEQLGINTESSSRRAGSEPETFMTTKNKYTFTDLDTSKRFVYRVRAVGEENTFSLWSEEKSFEFGTTGIGYLPVKVKETGSVRYFNLQGQEVNGTAKGLVIRKQGGETKKVMMK